ncbi:metal-dependent transcriptional regulator [Candidatus Latescibacterota bacterium]
MPLTESMENYLEAIFEIKKRKTVVRVRDVAKELGVTMPSVNGALKNLEAKGLVCHEKYEYIELTEPGKLHASNISSKHHMIFRFLNEILGVDEETAENDACKIEHDLSPSTLKKLTHFMKDK